MRTALRRIPTDIKDACFGSVYGAFIGDAAGGVLEFGDLEYQKAHVEEALKFEGGGYMFLKPGQITDDSEMAMCLMHGLRESGKNTFNQRTIAKWYVNWYDTEPKDIGITTLKSLE